MQKGRRHEKREWRFRKVSVDADAFRGDTTSWRATKIIGKVAALSGGIGLLLTLAGQIEKISEFYGYLNASTAQVTLATLLRNDALRRRIAASVAFGYHQNKVCVLEAQAADLGHAGRAADLLIRYVGEMSVAGAGTLDCDAFRDDPTAFAPMHQPFYMVAVRSGWGYTAIKPLTFDVPLQMQAVGPLLIFTNTGTDFPQSEVYAYYDKAIVLLGRFEHMLKIGTEDDEEIEVFDVARHGADVEIRSANGIDRVAWDSTTKTFQVKKLAWADLARNGQSVLYVEVSGNEEARIMLDGMQVETDDKGAARIEVSSLSRIVFDPHCQPIKGFTPVQGTLSAVVMELDGKDHVFECSLLTKLVKVSFAPK
jgi:hypothetical protein